MAYSITISTSIKQVNETDTLQLQLIFKVDLTGTNVSYSAQEKGIRVLKWGECEWKYDLEDAFLVPGTYNFTLGDRDGYLKNLLRGHDTLALATSKTPKVVLKLNGEIEFSGFVQEDSIDFSFSKRELKLTADPNIAMINKRKLYDDDSNPYTSLFPASQYNENDFYPILELITDIYRIVNPDLEEITTNVDLIFSGQAFDLRQLFDGRFDELIIKAKKFYFSNTAGISNAGDILRQLALNFGCFTGMINYDKVFFQKLFFYDASNLQTLGRVLDHSFRYMYSSLDYVKIVGHIDGYGYPLEATAGIDNAVEGKFLKKELVSVWFNNTFFLTDPTGLEVKMLIDRGDTEIDGDYIVYLSIDPGLDTTARDALELVKDYWWKWRGNIKNCSADIFEVQGIHYDFLKSFNHENGKYQILSLKKKYAQNQSEIEAIYLGELEE